jgi:signal transduction histidine kinase
MLSVMSGGGITRTVAAAPGLPGRMRAVRSMGASYGHYLGRVLLLVVLYRGAAEIGYALQFAGPVASIVWLPVGVGIAFLYLRGLAYWPGVLVGDLLANDYSTLNLGSAIGQTCGNVLEVVIATWLLTRLAPQRDPLARVRGVAGILAAIGAGTLVSATVGSASLLLGGVISGHDLPGVWRTWWLGDASGALIVLPLALAWAKPPWQWSRRRLAETGLMLAVLAALGLALRHSAALTYLVFPVLIWAALRLGRHGATLAVAVAAGFVIWETTRKTGPFVYDSATESLLATQLYIAVSAISALCLTAVVAERQAFAARLAASAARLVEAGAAERRRIERDLHDGAQQRLTAVLVRLHLAIELAHDAPDVVPGRLEAVAADLSEAIDELRELAHGIHPKVLTERGLAHALQSMAQTSTPPEVRVRELPVARVDPIAETTAYYVVAEAVTNARRHAGATAIEVRAAAAHGRLRVEIRDDGRGGAGEGSGSGLRGLRDRVEAIGGTLVVDSPNGSGTRIVATLPAAGGQTP